MMNRYYIEDRPFYLNLFGHWRISFQAYICIGLKTNSKYRFLPMYNAKKSLKEKWSLLRKDYIN